MLENQSRRRFLAAGAAASALAAGTTQEATAASNDEIKLGVFGLDFTFWGIWADLLSPTGAHSGTKLLNMRPYYVWDKDKKKAQDFADKWGCKVVKKFDGMVGKVDGVINGDLYNVPWQHKLMRPYLSAGVPVYLSRPWSSRLRDLDEILDLAAKHSAPLIATATYEHYNEADNFKGKLDKLGEIETVQAVCGAGDRPHFHIPYMMMKMFGYDVDTVSMITDNPLKATYLHSTYVMSASEGQKSYTINMDALKSFVYQFTAYGTEGTESGCLQGGASWFYRFFPQLMDIQKTFDTKKNYQSFDIVRKKFECVLAEYFSHHERGGTPVKVGSVSQDWQIPPAKPGWYSDSDF